MHVNFNACSLSLWLQSPPLKSIVICRGRSKHGSIPMVGISHDCPATLLLPEIKQSAFSVSVQLSGVVGGASGVALGDSIGDVVSTGSDMGADVSCGVGSVTGDLIGAVTGNPVGAAVSSDVGSASGDPLGASVSAEIGTGAAVSSEVGSASGDPLGAPVSAEIGTGAGTGATGVGSTTGDPLGAPVSVEIGTGAGSGAIGVGAGGVGGTSVGGSGETIKLYSSVASQDAPSGCGSASIITLAENSPPVQMSTSRVGLSAVDSPGLIGFDCSMSTKLNVSLSIVKSTVVTFIGTVPTLLISNV